MNVLFGLVLFIIFMIAIDLVFCISKSQAVSVVDLYHVIEKILPSANVNYNYKSNSSQEMIVYFDWRNITFVNR